MARKNSNGDDWHACLRWMASIGFIAPDHRLLKPNSRISDFAKFLQDGVVLCHMLNKLSPGILGHNSFNSLPESQFVNIENAKAFLDGCTRAFQIPTASYFDAAKLAKMENINEVVQFILMLSRMTTSAANNRREITGSIRETAVSASDYETQEEAVYGRLIDVGCTYQTKTSDQSMLTFCTQELLDTEKNYNNTLETLSKMFSNPLRGVMRIRDHGLIFYRIKDLLQVHRDFYDELKKSTEEECPFDLADIFIKYKERFLLYGHYCRKLTSALDLLNELTTRDRSFRERLKECEKKNGGKFETRLFEYLHVPMQRFLKYPLFLKELIKYSPSQKKRSLEVALDETQDLAHYVNEVKRDHEILNLIRALQKKIENLPEKNLKDCGRLIKDGEVKLKIGSRSSLNKRLLFVFDKKIFICKKQKNVYSFKECFETQNVSCGDPKKSKNQYTCLVKFGNTEKCIVLGGHEPELNEWMQAIRTARDNVSPLHSQSSTRTFELATFSTVRICDVCKKLLRGMFCQGYHCKDNGEDIAAHKHCLEKAQRIENVKSLFPKHEGSLFPIVRQHSSTDYVNSFLEYQPWFVGYMSRDQAFELLSLFGESTFLVRVSPRGHEEYSLNIKYLQKVQNIKIEKKQGKFYISKVPKFSGLSELISYYETTSLSTVFNEIKTTLVTPIGDATPSRYLERRYAIADMPASNDEFLDISCGNIIFVIKKTTNNVWLGYFDCRIGKFHVNLTEAANEC